MLTPKNKEFNYTPFP